MDQLLSRDEQYWEEHLRDAQKTLETYRINLKQLLERQTKEIEHLL